MASSGQMEHVFVFIMMIFLAGVVLVLGFKYLGLLFTESCVVEKVQFLDEFTDALSESEYGTVRTATVTAPCGAQQVCFVDSSRYGTLRSDGTYPGNLKPGRNIRDALRTAPTNPSISWSNNYQVYTSPTNNLRLMTPNRRILEMAFAPSTPPSSAFLIKNGATEPLNVFTEKLALAPIDRVLCVNATGGTFMFRTEGRGKSVLVTA